MIICSNIKINSLLLFYSSIAIYIDYEQINKPHFISYYFSYSMSQGPLYRRPCNHDMRKKCCYRLLVTNSHNTWEYIIILGCGIMYDLFSKY